MLQKSRGECNVIPVTTWQILLPVWVKMQEVFFSLFHAVGSTIADPSFCPRDDQIYKLWKHVSNGLIRTVGLPWAPRN